MSGPGYRFRLRTDLAANLPAASGSPFAFFYATDTSEFEFSDGVAWQNFSVTPLNPVYYVDPVGGSDANTGLAANAALLTIGEALRRLSRGYRGTATVNVATGSLASLTASTVWNIPAGSGAGAGPVVFAGTVTPDTTLGTGGDITATAGAIGSGVSFGTVTQAGALVANAWVGYMVRFTSGTPNNIGVRRQIVSNTGTGANDVFTIAGTWPAAPVNGDHFVVEKATTVQPATNATLNIYAPTGVVFNGFDFQSSAILSINVNAGEAAFVNGRLTGAGQTRINVIQGIVTTFPLSVAFGSTLPFAGLSVGSACFIGNGSTDGFIFVTRSVFASGSLGLRVTSATRASCSNSQFNGPPLVVGGSSTTPPGTVGVSTCVFVSPTSVGISAEDCPSLWLTTVVITGATSDAVSLKNTAARITALTGTGNTGNGLTIGLNSRVRVTDPNTGTTIGTDVVRAVKVGSNAVDTWANINGGAIANWCDFAAGSGGLATSLFATCRLG